MMQDPSEWGTHSKLVGQTGHWIFLNSRIPFYVINRGKEFPSNPKDGQVFYLTHKGKKCGQYVFSENFDMITVPNSLFDGLVLISEIVQRSNMLNDLRVSIDSLLRQSEFWKNQNK